jgi:hypothetical protein
VERGKSARTIVTNNNPSVMDKNGYQTGEVELYAVPVEVVTAEEVDVIVPVVDLEVNPEPPLTETRRQQQRQTNRQDNCCDNIIFFEPITLPEESWNCCDCDYNGVCDFECGGCDCDCDCD